MPGPNSRSMVSVMTRLSRFTPSGRIRPACASSKCTPSRNSSLLAKTRDSMLRRFVSSSYRFVIRTFEQAGIPWHALIGHKAPVRSMNPSLARELGFPLFGIAILAAASVRVTDATSTAQPSRPTQPPNSRRRSKIRELRRIQNPCAIFSISVIRHTPLPATPKIYKPLRQQP